MWGSSTSSTFPQPAKGSKALLVWFLSRGLLDFSDVPAYDVWQQEACRELAKKEQSELHGPSRIEGTG